MSTNENNKNEVVREEDGVKKLTYQNFFAP